MFKFEAWWYEVDNEPKNWTFEDGLKVFHAYLERQRVEYVRIPLSVVVDENEFFFFDSFMLLIRNNIFRKKKRFRKASWMICVAGTSRWRTRWNGNTFSVAEKLLDLALKFRWENLDIAIALSKN